MADTEKILGIKIVVDNSGVNAPLDQLRAAMNRAADDITRLYADTGKYAQALQNIQTELGKTAQGTERYNQLLNQQRQILSQQVQVQNQVTDSAKKSSLSMSDISSGLKSIGVMAGVAGIALMTVKEILDFGEQGATILQLRESFARLTGTGEESAQMLERLRKATRGTMDDEKLMAPLLQMLAGSEGEFADKVKESAPLIYEMAAASAKLNPTLGTTSQILDSMASSLEMGTTRGLKRLGIIIDSDKAEKEYADSIGKTRDQLTEEEKKVANLNGALEYHDKLLRQVGGTVDNATDPFKRLGVAIGNISDNIKTSLAPGLATAAEALEIILTSTNKVNAALAEHSRNVMITAQSYEEYVKEMERANSVALGGRTGYPGLNQGLKPQPILTPEQFETTRSDKQLTDLENLRMQRTLDIMKAQDRAEDIRLAKEKEFQDKLTDIILKSGEGIVGLEAKLVQDRLDAQIDFYRKLEDITIGGVRRREDIELKYARAVEDAELDYQAGVENGQQEHTNKLVDIEEKYQDRIRSAQRKFKESAMDAIRNLDAIALRRAYETRNAEMEDAAHDRDRETGKENRDYSQRNEEARRALERKRQDADRARARELADQQKDEARARADANRDYAQKLSDLKRHNAAKLAEMQAAFARELQEINSRVDGEIAALQRLAAARAMLTSLGFGVPRIGGGSEESPRKRATGGVDLVNGPTQFLFGEGGMPELVISQPLGAQSVLPAPMSINHLISGTVNQNVMATVQSQIKGMEGRIAATIIMALSRVIR